MKRKYYAVAYTPNANDPCATCYVGSVSDYLDGGLSDPVIMSKESAEALLKELDSYVRNDERFADKETSIYCYNKKEWGFWVEEFEINEEEL